MPLTNLLQIMQNNNFTHTIKCSKNYNCIYKKISSFTKKKKKKTYKHKYAYKYTQIGLKHPTMITNIVSYIWFPYEDTKISKQY